MTRSISRRFAISIQAALFTTAFLVIAVPFSVQAQQWTRLGPPGSGGVYSLANEGDTIYAGTQSWLIRSTNLGDTWTDASGGLPFGFLPLSMSAGGGILYVAVNSGTENGIYRSTDHGATWTSSSNGLPLGSYARVVGFHRGRVYAGVIGMLNSTVGGLYSSSNNGASWSQVPGGPDTNVTSFAAAGDTLFAGTTVNTIFISTNLGQTWWDTTVSAFAGIEIRGILPAHPFLYASVATLGIHRSSDNGRSWIPMNDGISQSAFMPKPLERIGETIFVGVDNGGAQPCGGIWKSTNQGDVWQRTSTYRMTRSLPGVCLDTAYYLTAALLARNQTLFAGTFGYGVFKSTNLGISWQQVAAPMQTYSLSTLAQSGDTLYAAGENGGGLFLSTDNGEHWDQYLYELHGWIPSILKKDQSLFAGQGAGAGVARSSDGGQTWTRSTAGPTNTVNCLATGNGVLYAGTENGLFKSTNDGSQWSTTAYTVPAHNLLVRGNTILVNRTEFGTPRTFRSTNAGASFDTVSGGLPTNFIARDYVEMGQRILAIGVALGSGAVYSSIDDGSTWTNISGPLTGGGCSAVSGDTLYVSGTIGASVVLRRTTNFGQTWTSVSTTGLSNGAFEDLIVHNGYLFGVRGAGQTSVWRMPLNGSVDVGDENEIPATFSVGQNYPNPFNPTTSISFAVPQRMLVTLTVYDILGREVETVIHRELPSGRHDVRWNAENNASGVYLYRLTAGGYSQTRKMLLVR